MPTFIFADITPAAIADDIAADATSFRRYATMMLFEITLLIFRFDATWFLRAR